MLSWELQPLPPRKSSMKKTLQELQAVQTIFHLSGGLPRGTLVYPVMAALSHIH